MGLFDRELNGGIASPLSVASSGGGGGGGTPGGADTQVQYNDGGAFGGDALFRWVNPQLFLGPDPGGAVPGKLFINTGGASDGFVVTNGVTAGDAAFIFKTFSNGVSFQGTIGTFAGIGDIFIQREGGNLYVGGNIPGTYPGTFASNGVLQVMASGSNQNVFTLLGPSGEGSFSMGTLDASFGNATFIQSSDQTTVTPLRLNAQGGDIIVGGTILPVADDDTNLGSPSFRFSDGHFANILRSFAFLNDPAAANLNIFTEDVTAANSAGIWARTGTTTTSGDSGAWLLETGSAAGSSGIVTLRTGTAGSERGYIDLDALFTLLPRLAADPTHSGLVAGAVYYNTGTDKIKMYNGTTWETVTSV